MVSTRWARGEHVVSTWWACHAAFGLVPVRRASSLSSWALCSGDLTRLSWTLIQLGSAVKFLVLRSQRLALPLWAALRFLQHPAASMEVGIGGLPSPNTLRHPPTKICCYFFRDATAEPAIDWSWSFLHTASAGVWGRDTEYMWCYKKNTFSWTPTLQATAQSNFQTASSILLCGCSTKLQTRESSWNFTKWPFQLAQMRIMFQLLAPIPVRCQVGILMS